MDFTEPDKPHDTDNSSTKKEAQGVDNSSIKDESEDIGKKMLDNGEAEQKCHNVSVPLFTAK